jgi:tRNA-specific 2-thiouridylase
MARVVVGMSGGVDSAVAAMLLRDAGHDVAGLFMKNWDDDDGTEYCTAAADLLEADGACHRLGIPLLEVNFARQYWDDVFAHFLTEYRAGRTPNPDVLCNREIKFKVFQQHAEALGADYVATGHYARLLRNPHGRPGLHCAADANKDQTYFLHAVPALQFERVLFPLGGLQKPQVRRLAADAGLHNHGRKDSTGICFIGERRFRDFLDRYLPAQPGEIRGPAGELLGEHVGLMHYTIGQRQGIGLGGRRSGSGEAWYVADKDLGSNTLRVVQGAEHPALAHLALHAEAAHWLAEVELPLHCSARIRYRQASQDCMVLPGTDPGTLLVRFTTPQRAVTPGQYAVFYAGDRCLGGAVITGPAA